MGWLKRVDRFLLAIVTAAVVATVLPAQGVTVPVLEWVTKAAVAVLFFVYGARLKPDQALAGLKHWRLHLTILGLTFVVFPVIGWGLQVLSPWLLSPSLYAGVLYLTPVFPAESTHRYDASSFATVDPLLGGDARDPGGRARRCRGESDSDPRADATAGVRRARRDRAR